MITDTQTPDDVKTLVPEAPPAPTLSELQTPTISFKDRKILMFLYEGKLKKPEKLRGLIRKGYCEVNEKNEIVPTVLGMLLIDFTVRQRNTNADARKKHKQPTSRKNAVNRFGQRKQRDTGNVSIGQLGSGDSGEVTDPTAAYLIPTD